jgi:phosphate starvation-inducible PhoH-like protein
VKDKSSKHQNHESTSLSMMFDDNRLLSMLLGHDDAHLARIERQLGITASSRGSVVELEGEKAQVDQAHAVLKRLYDDLRKGSDVGSAQVDAAIRMVTNQDDGLFGSHDISIKTMKKNIKPYSPIQAQYIEKLQKNDLVFALGPAGTGKTYIAVAMAVAHFISGRVEKIILSRPAVEAGEKLGFLPGDLKEKIDPYLRPLYDSLFDMIPAEKLARHMENGEIEVAPLAFMRGRTFSNAFVILDEAQNTTATQMKMFLTRMGENSRMVATGDLSQTDLPKDVKSGLGDAVRKLEGIDGIGLVRFSDKDVVRHALAAKIIKAYDEWDRKKKLSSRQQMDDDVK